MIRLRFTREKGFQPWLVRTATWFGFDHVELALESGFLGARPDVGVQLLPRECCDEPLTEVYAHVKIDAWSACKVIEFAKSQIDKPYDWAALYGVLNMRDWRDQEKWICSELIAAAFEHAGMPLLNGDKQNRISPRDIALSPYLSFTSRRP